MASFRIFFPVVLIQTYLSEVPARTTIVQPYLSDEHGNMLSPFILNRNTRSTWQKNYSDQTSRFYISIDRDSSSILLELEPNQRLITAKTRVEWVDENEDTTTNKFRLDCFYLGRNLKSNSRRIAAISNCDGLSGYIETDEATYLIEPLEKHSLEEGSSTPEEAPNLNLHKLYEIEDIRDGSHSTVNTSFPQGNDLDAWVNDITSHFLHQNSRRHMTDINILKRTPRSLKRNKRVKVRTSHKRNIKSPKRKSKRVSKKVRANPKKSNRKRRGKKKGKKKKRRNSKSRRKNRKEKKKTPSEIPVLASQKATDVLFSTTDWQGYSADTFEDIIRPAYTTRNSNEANMTKPIERWLEVSIGVDHTVIDFHGEESVEKYIMTLFNIVSAIYEDSSLNARLNIVILRLIFYKHKNQSQIKQGFAKKSLEAVNRWSERLHAVSPSSLKHDMAVWLTKEELGGPSGYAPVGGVCQPHRSCTLNRDEGLTSAFIIAHEMAHVLGMSHDGDEFAGNSCREEGFYGFVMAPLVSATFNRFHWSSCSKLEYHHLAPSWICMGKPPDWGNSVSVSSDVPYHYTLDEQCRMEFGKSFQHCERYSSVDPCTFLWCSNGTSHICKTKKGPPLEGTTCGKNMWCRYGFCEKKPEDVIINIDNNTIIDAPLIAHNPRDGGWSSWSSWGFCSRTCGSGVTFKMRSCNNPKPKWGGKQCEGRKERWKLCSTQPCPDLSDLRAQQCDLLPYLVRLGKRRSKLTWIPYEPKRSSRKCRLSCWSKETTEIYMTKEFVLDGTRCSYDEADSICVQGSCHVVGCDGNIASAKKVDDCGVCGGNGSTCLHKEYIYDGTPLSEYQEIMIIPAQAWKISVTENFHSPNTLGLMVNSEIVLGGYHSEDSYNTIITNGARFRYTENNGIETIEALGPLIKPISVMIFSDVMNETSSVSISFFIQKKNIRYKWKTQSWEPCSTTCGGGVQSERLICQDEDENINVELEKCKDIIKPETKSRACNLFSCDFVWIADAWEHCTKTCGTNGVQERMVSCVIWNSTNFSENRNFVHPDKCDPKTKPISLRECNRIECPGYWKLDGWSQCSSTCGMGYQTESFLCLSHVPNISAACQYDLTPGNRSCMGEECNNLECKDESEFCQIESLIDYCAIPQYRERCCRTCLLENTSYQALSVE